MTTSTNLHTAWARLVVRALADAGVRDLVVSPGSRSTPLALAAAEERSLRAHVHVDERVAAFFALGLARASGRPSALVCTSGTAGAHWLPAAIEAELAAIPMVCITADRPWEAYDCASPQTIDQVDLLGRHARHRAELGTPDPSPAALRAVGRVVAQCVARSIAPTPGPVHLNARFRKPLEPVLVREPEPWTELVDRLLTRPATRVYEPVASPSPEAIARIAAAVRGAQRGWVVCGPSMTHDPEAARRDRDAVHALCRATRFALLAEAPSGARFGAGDGSLTTLPVFDQMLRASAFEARARPDVVIELGLPPTSSAYAQWVAAHPETARHVVAPHHWPDPHASAESLVRCPIDAFVSALAHALADHHPSDSVEAWSRAMRDDALKARAALEATVSATSLTEATVPAAIARALPEAAVLCVGNSLPARDIDAFTASETASLRVLHQRGASGIDGLVAGAAGARATTDPAHPVLVYLGDISLTHDLGGLNAASAAREPLVIVAVQNGGGRIFEQLPLGRQAAHDPGLARRFERFFLTPQGVSFELAAGAFGVAYRRATTRDAFERALVEAFEHRGATLIEAVTEGDGRAMRDAAAAAVRDAIS